MIEKVSLSQPKVAVSNLSKEKKEVNVNTVSPNREFADSFMKHAAQSTPMLLSLTGLWTILDYGAKRSSIKGALINNIRNFYLPVLFVSSLVLAGIENKEYLGKLFKKNSKN